MRVTLVYRGVHLYRQALDLETLAPVLRSAGHQVTMVYDPDTFGVTDNVLRIPRLAKLLSNDEKTITRIVASRPEAVVFSVLPATFTWCRKLAAELKQLTSAPLVFLGLHPTLVPEHVMASSCADYAIAGEAENVINNLLETIAVGGDVSSVGNLWRRTNGQAVYTHPAELVDLDALPLPDKELFADYVSHRYSYPAMVSRGCPFECTFCEETCSKRFYGSKYFRQKSVDTVMRELVAGKRRHHYREVIFKDSYLSSGNKRWLRQLMQRYRDEIRVPFKCFCTITGFDQETARLLKEGGCYSVEFGLQTWNDEIRRNILNRRETSEDAFRVFEHCDKQRLRYDVDHMFFLPHEATKDHILGAECYQRLRYLGRIKVHFLLYLPTADIVEHGVAAGDLPPDVSERLSEGLESNFYDQAAFGEERRNVVAGYAALYKILPMLPASMVQWLLQGDRVRRLRKLPSVLMLPLQGVNAIRCGDLRFLAYLRSYPIKIFRSLLSLAARRTPSPRCGQ